MSIFNIYPMYAIIIMLIIEITIVLFTYDHDEFIGAFIYALFETLFPVLVIKLNWLKLSGIEKEVFIHHNEFSNLIIIFIVQYIIAVLSLKLANSFTSGTTGKIAYLFVFMIANSLVVTIFTDVIKIL